MKDLWDHRIHRRPVGEFTRDMPNRRTITLGEWMNDINGLCEQQTTKGSFHEYTPSVWEHQSDCPGVLSYYDAGFFDGLHLYEPNNLDNTHFENTHPGTGSREHFEYLMGYTEGLNTVAMNKYSGDK